MKNQSRLADTDLCVMCGMCLPSCPTYQLYQTETESPRGRIALMQAIQQGRIRPDGPGLKHIDHCLGCLNCESLCPSAVPYGRLIDEFRHLYQRAIGKPLMSRYILRQATRPAGIDKLNRLATRPPVRQLLRLSGLASPLSQALTGVSGQKLNSFYPAAGRRLGEVALFTGCAGKTADPETIRSAIFLLNRLGQDVRIPDQQYCCGALHQHNGQLERAATLRHQNRQQFPADTPKLLFFSPACGSQLQLEGIAAEDIQLFLTRQLQQQPMEFSPLGQPVALHQSCSQLNSPKLKSASRNLLGFIPRLRRVESSQPTLCCGAGGLQAINYPEQGQALLKLKLDSFDWSAVEILLSDNIGCSLHIKSALSGYNSAIEVLHPISLLARQLINHRKNPR